MKAKWIILVATVLVLAVLFVPWRSVMYRDGGTRDFRALTYTVVVWSRMTPDMPEGIYHGTSVFWFPDSRKGIDMLWAMEMEKNGPGAPVAPSSEGEGIAVPTPVPPVSDSEPGPTAEPATSPAAQIPVLVIEAGGKTFYATFEDNSSAAALTEKLSAGALTLELHDYGSFEKVGALPWSLPTNDERITTTPGDIILYQGNQITIYYDQNTWSFTKLAHIDGATKDALLAALGAGNVTVRFSLEWRDERP